MTCKESVSAAIARFLHYARARFMFGALLVSLWLLTIHSLGSGSVLFSVPPLVDACSAPIVTLSTHHGNYFAPAYASSLGRNRIAYTLTYEADADGPSGRSWWITHGAAGNITFCIDSADDSFRFDHACLIKADFYFKSSFSSHLLSLRPDPAVLPFRHKIFGYPIKIQREGYTLPPRSPAGRTTILSSYSRSTTFVADTRARLYDALRNLSNYNTALVDLLITHVEEGRYVVDIPSNRLLPGCTPDFDNVECYYQFLRSSWFLLNLQGIGLSTSARLQDACITGTAVASEAVFTDAASDFPVFPLSSNSHAAIIPMSGIDSSGINATALARELHALFSDYETIYYSLIVRQRLWCRQHLSDEAYIHQLFRRFPGAPFSACLRNTNAYVHDLVYHDDSL